MTFAADLETHIEKIIVAAVVSDMKHADWDPVYTLSDYADGAVSGGGTKPSYFLSGTMAWVDDGPVTASQTQYGIKVYWDGRATVYEVLGEEDCSASGTGLEPLGAGIEFLALRKKWEAAITELFAPWLEIPDPVGFDAPFTQLRSALVPLHAGGKLATGGDDLRDQTMVKPSEPRASILAIENTLQDWLGPAAGSFNGNFMQLLPGTIQCQHDAILLAMICVRSEREIWTCAREELLSLASAAGEAMAASGDSGNGAQRQAAVLGAVQYVTSFIPVVGKVVEGLVTAGELIETFGSHGTPAQPTNLKIAGGSADEVYTSMANELDNGVAKSIQIEEQAIHDLASDLWSQMIANPEIYDMSQKARKLLNNDDPDEIVNPDAEMRVQPDSLRKAANGPIRQWGKETLAVSTKLEISGTKAAWTRPSSIGLGTYGPLPQLDGMLEMLRRLLERFSVTLDATADHLVLAADGYESVDSGAEAALRTNLAELREERRELRETHDNRPPDVSSVEGNPWAEQYLMPGYEYVETPDGPKQVPST